MYRTSTLWQNLQLQTPVKTKRPSPHDQFKRLAPVDLVKEMVHQLRSQIIAGHYGTDGELPTESQLSESFGVSRTVARESMRTLRALGLVEVSRGRRPRVRPVDPQIVVDSLQSLLLRSNASLHDLGEVRRPLEIEIAGLAASRATREDTEAMQAAIDMQAAARTSAKQVEADRRFHELLASSTGNSLLRLMLSTIAPLINESRRRTISRVGIKRALAGHIAILNAVNERDVVAARDAMATHLRMAEEDLAKEKL
jgi:GntR family transcriptional repressor for pyruvate dehydrogenase complex